MAPFHPTGHSETPPKDQGVGEKTRLDNQRVPASRSNRDKFRPALPKIHERGKRLRVEARSAHKRAIQFLLRHQPPNIVGLDAAAVENPEGGGEGDGKLLPRASPKNPMSCRGNFRGRRAARADGPNRFVCNQNTGELVRGQRAGAAAELAAEHLFGKASLAVLLRFSQANNGREAASQRHQGLLGDIVIRLTKKLAALGVADDDVAATGFGKHEGGNFAGEGAFLAPGDVLTSDGDAGAFRGFDSGAYCGERRGDDDVAVLCAGNERKGRGEKRASGRERFVHFPVAGDYAASHEGPQGKKR